MSNELYVNEDKEKLVINDSVEEETLYDEGKEPISNKIYDPSYVNITSDPLGMRNILDRFEYDEIELAPIYQRKSGLWSNKQKSRLIESILISIPLPNFYIDVRDPGHWEIVDGLQRLTAIKEFMYDKTLVLENLEFLKNLNNKKFDDLPRPFIRKLNETNFSAYFIKKGTPDDVTINIFKRINTGGITLSLAEIRNAVYKGMASILIKELAESKEFLKATRNKIKTDRMEDRDLVTRFVAFYIQDINLYDGVMDDFLDDSLTTINDKVKEKKWNQNNSNSLKKAFIASMNCCIQLFGEKAFRKLIKKDDGTFSEKFGPLNKALFECESVCLARLSEKEQKFLISKKELVFHKYKELFSTSFYDCINSATGTIEHVQGRYKLFSDFLQKCLGEK